MPDTSTRMRLTHTLVAESLQSRLVSSSEKYKRAIEEEAQQRVETGKDEGVKKQTPVETGKDEDLKIIFPDKKNAVRVRRPRPVRRIQHLEPQNPVAAVPARTSAPHASEAPRATAAAQQRIVAPAHESAPTPTGSDQDTVKKLTSARELAATEAQLFDIQSALASHNAHELIPDSRRRALEFQTEQEQKELDKASSWIKERSDQVAKTRAQMDELKNERHQKIAEPDMLGLQQQQDELEERMRIDAVNAEEAKRRAEQERRAEEERQERIERQERLAKLQQEVEMEKQRRAEDLQSKWNMIDKLVEAGEEWSQRIQDRSKNTDIAQHADGLPNSGVLHERIILSKEKARAQRGRQHVYTCKQRRAKARGESSHI